MTAPSTSWTSATRMAAMTATFTAVVAAMAFFPPPATAAAPRYMIVEVAPGSTRYLLDDWEANLGVLTGPGVDGAIPEAYRRPSLRVWLFWGDYQRRDVEDEGGSLRTTSANQTGTLFPAFEGYRPVIALDHGVPPRYVEERAVAYLRSKGVPTTAQELEAAVRRSGDDRRVGWLPLVVVVLVAVAAGVGLRAAGHRIDDDQDARG